MKFSYNNYYLEHSFSCEFATIVEFGFQHNNYTISEQNLFNETVICILIKEELLEKNVKINLTIIDETTEGMHTTGTFLGI